MLFRAEMRACKPTPQGRLKEHGTLVVFQEAAHAQAIEAAIRWAARVFELRAASEHWNCVGGLDVHEYRGDEIGPSGDLLSGQSGYAVFIWKRRGGISLPSCVHAGIAEALDKLQALRGVRR